MRGSTMFLAVFVAACSSSVPTGPSSIVRQIWPQPATLAPSRSLSGRWRSTFAVTDCSRIGGSFFDCGTIVRGSTHPALLVLLQSGETVTGKAVYGSTNPNFTSEFATTLEPDGGLRMLTGWGQSPMTVFQVQWDLRFDGRSGFTGTLTSTSRSYRSPGAVVAAGVVEVTREYPDAPFL